MCVNSNIKDWHCRGPLDCSWAGWLSGMIHSTLLTVTLWLRLLQRKDGTQWTKGKVHEWRPEETGCKLSRPFSQWSHRGHVQFQTVSNYQIVTTYMKCCQSGKLIGDSVSKDYIGSDPEDTLYLVCTQIPDSKESRCLA